MRDQRFERPLAPISARCPEFETCPGCHRPIRVLTEDRRRAARTPDHEIKYQQTFGDGVIGAFVTRCRVGEPERLDR